MKDEPTFSLNDFRNWIYSHAEEGRIILSDDNRLQPGDQVLVRLSESNMISKLSKLNESKSDLVDICKLVRENGGILKSISGTNATITVPESNKTLVVPRLFLRRPKVRE